MKTTFVCVEWLHDLSTEPIRICAELDDKRFEIRKVEFFSNGSKIKVDRELSEIGSTRLSNEPWPNNMDIANNPDENFRVTEITSEEFQALWSS